MRSIKSVFGNEVTLHPATVKHVLKRHPEMAKLRDLDKSMLLTITSPDFVLGGKYGENIAARRIKAGALKGKWMVVPYEEGGRIKTALISNVEKIIKGRTALWKR